MSEHGQLIPAQVDVLLRPINPRRVLQAQGQSHIPAYDVVAHLTRVFGFEGWDKEIVSLDLVHERCVGANDKTQGRWWVTYRCVMRLTVRDPKGRVVTVKEDGATGSAQNMPSPADAHDFAMKNAISYAIKRCAKDLGDQFGLSLYNKGSTSALLAKLVVSGATDVEDHVPAPLSMGNDERQEAEPPASVDAETGEVTEIKQARRRPPPQTQVAVEDEPFLAQTEQRVAIQTRLDAIPRQYRDELAAAWKAKGIHSIKSVAHFTTADATQAEALLTEFETRVAAEAPFAEEAS